MSSFAFGGGGERSGTRSDGSDDLDEEDPEQSSSSTGGSRGRREGPGGGKGRHGGDDEEAVDNEYYSFLHVARTATPQEITAAYKKLSRIYHPDKHTDPAKKLQAEALFSNLKEAHQTLSDPHKRAIYDCLGKRGLVEQGWEVVRRTKSPQEIREEFERLASARAERSLQQLTNPTSRLQMTINATDLFERYLYDEQLDDVIESGLPRVEVSEITLSQTIEAPLSQSQRLTLSGDVSTRNGTGSGSVGCVYRKVLADSCWYELNGSVGQGGSFGARMYRVLTKHTFANVSGSVQLGGGGVKPSFSLSLGNHLGKSTVGYLTYTTNGSISEHGNEVYALSQEQSGMSTMIVKDMGKYHLMASVQFGIPHTYLMASVTRKFDAAADPSTNKAAAAHQQVRARGAVKLGTFGALLEYGVEKRLTAHNTLGATMVVGVPFGVTLRIKFTRSSQTYLFPLHLADEVLMQPIFYGSVVPLLAWYTAKKLVLDPLELRRKEAERKKLREANLARMAEAKKVANSSIDLMMERFDRIRSDETAKGGLVILLAIYGKIYDGGPSPLDVDELLKKRRSLEPQGAAAAADRSKDYEPVDLSSYPEVIDVTVPTQCLVEGSRLVFFESSKAELAGFYDPCTLLHGEQKHLLIRYLHRGTAHQVILPDDEACKLPKTQHRLAAAPAIHIASGTD